MKINTIYNRLLKIRSTPGILMIVIALSGKNCQSKYLLKSLKLPTKGRIRFVPRKTDVLNCRIRFANGGYIDKFGNTWVRPNGKIRDDFHWDVQLTVSRQARFKWILNSGNRTGRTHLNVTQQGTIHH